jgi:hypothetical protein
MSICFLHIQLPDDREAAEDMMLTIEATNVLSSPSIARFALRSKTKGDVEAGLSDSCAEVLLDMIEARYILIRGIPNNGHAIGTCCRPKGDIDDDQQVKGVRN